MPAGLPVALVDARPVIIDGIEWGRVDAIGQRVPREHYPIYDEFYRHRKWSLANPHNVELLKTHLHMISVIVTEIHQSEPGELEPDFPRRRGLTPMPWAGGDGHLSTEGEVNHHGGHGAGVVK
jgi:hypothetical protein